MRNARAQKYTRTPGQSASAREESWPPLQRRHEANSRNSTNTPRPHQPCVTGSRSNRRTRCAVSLSSHLVPARTPCHTSDPATVRTRQTHAKATSRRGISSCCLPSRFRPLALGVRPRPLLKKKATPRLRTGHEGRGPTPHPFGRAPGPPLRRRSASRCRKIDSRRAREARPERSTSEVDPARARPRFCAGSSTSTRGQPCSRERTPPSSASGLLDAIANALRRRWLCGTQRRRPS